MDTFGFAVVCSLTICVVYLVGCSHGGIIAGDQCKITNDKNRGIFWQVSDFHLDTNYSITGKPDHMCHAEKNEKHASGNYGNYKCDAPWKLVVAAIDGMKTLHAEPDFILWTGDTVPHVINADLNPQKIYVLIKNVTTALQNAFPNISIYPVLGNHDPYPSNQMPFSALSYYKNILEKSSWDTLLKDKQQKEFQKGGYYTSLLAPGLRIVGLNTNLYYSQNNLTDKVPDPAEQFKWLKRTLDQARKQREMVYIVSHVPPGAFERVPKIKWFYPDFNAQYLEILHRFSDIISGQFYGHEHTDSFKIMYNKQGVPVSQMYLAPAVTPWKSTLPGVGANNPSIRLYHYDRKTGKVLDICQYFLNLTAANDKQVADWSLEYRATTYFGIDDVGPVALDKLVQSFSEHGNGNFHKYLKCNSVSHGFPKPCDKSCRRWQICAITMIDYGDYDMCLSGKHPTTQVPHSTTTDHHHRKRYPKYMYYIICTLAVVLLILFIVVMVLCSKRRHLIISPRYMKLPGSTAIN